MLASEPKAKKRKFLPDYEPAYPTGYAEGTWVPTLYDSGSTGASLASKNGHWIRIGNLVWVNFSMVCNSISGVIATDSMRVGLPFAQASGITSSSGSIGYITYVAATKMGDHLAPRVDSTNDFCYLVASSEASGGASLTFNDILNGGNTTIRGCICYKVNEVTYP